MYAKLFAALLLVSFQILLNEASGVQKDWNPASALISWAVRRPRLPEGYVAFPSDGLAYKIYEEEITWPEALDRCIEEGARLAVADTLEKVVHINSTKGAWAFTQLQRLHVGIYKSPTTNQWVRRDNHRPVTGAPWGREEPDGTGNCAAISSISNDLVDIECNWPYFFVCEIPLV